MRTASRRWSRCPLSVLSAQASNAPHQQSERAMTGVYEVFGLRVSSELPLPELTPASGDWPIDIEIRRGTFDRSPAETRNVYLAGQDLVLDISKAGRYRIRAGREILVEPAQGASERSIRLFLLGSSLGALLHQRKLLPLHANAIAVEGKAVAVAGSSGAGKSTLAAWFEDRGRCVLTDDVCVVGRSAEGQLLAFPGIRRLRLS